MLPSAVGWDHRFPGNTAMQNEDSVCGIVAQLEWVVFPAPKRRRIHLIPLAWLSLPLYMKLLTVDVCVGLAHRK